MLCTLSYRNLFPIKITGYQGKLGGWVQNQRAKYKARKKGKESSLTDEQIKKLEDCK